MNTEILKIKGDWEEVVDDCRATVAKPPLGKEPRSTWKWAMVIAEHDPIRDIIIKFKWIIPYWVAMHWKTHIWRSRTNTQRNDRQQNYDREEAPQNVPVVFIGDANIQHLIDTWRKRLCFIAASKTRACAISLKKELRAYEPEASDALVPNCIYRAGCPEPKSCGWYEKAVEKYPALASTDISTRYKAYNDLFYGRVESVENG